MSIDIDCPICGEADDLQGERFDDHIDITCGNCGQSWQRSTSPVCPLCAGTELQAVPLAIVEKSRGTQLSVVGIRIVHMCIVCDADDIDHWQKYRPNPLLPRELPTIGDDTERA